MNCFKVGAGGGQQEYVVLSWDVYGALRMLNQYFSHGVYVEDIELIPTPLNLKLSWWSECVVMRTFQDAWVPVFSMPMRD